MSRKLIDRRVIVTGAGSGLGKAIAEHFAREGWKVAASDRDVAAARTTVSGIEAAGGTALAFACDVTSEPDFAALIAAVNDKWGGFDVLVNNAGVATAGTIAEAPIEQWQWVLNINVLGVVRGCRAAIPTLAAQGGGHIVNVASFAGIANPPAMASYNAAKAAVISVSESLRFEMYAQGVGVSVACPSFFKTNLMASSQRSAPGGQSSTAPQMEKIVARLMDKAEITSEDVARDIFDAVEKNRFLVITHPDARARYHLKRVAPELFFRMARKATEKFLSVSR